ncbi:MAG: histidine kinase dimerization/phospho-acceptor domain-containing protein, partial [Candidatus Hydrogenedentota bacterium]
MKLGVRHRVGIAAAFGVIVAGALLATGFWWLFRAQLLQTAREDLLRQAWRIGESADEGLEFAPDDERRLVHAAILDTAGRTIEADGIPMEGLSTWPIVLEALAGRSAYGGPDEYDRIFVAVPVEEEREWLPPGQAMPAAVVLVASVSERLAAARTLALYLAGFVPIAALLAGLGGAWLAGRALAPVDSMVRTASSIEGSGLSTRLDVSSSSDEIAHLATTLNAMLDRIESAFQHNIRFIADASHEIRNPLTNLSSEIQVLLRQDRRPDEYRAALESALEEVRRLSRIADDLLFLARADAGQ